MKQKGESFPGHKDRKNEYGTFHNHSWRQPQCPLIEMPHFPSPDSIRSEIHTRSASEARVAAPPSDERCSLVAKGGVIFPVGQNTRTPMDKRNIWTLPCPWGYLLSSLFQLSQGITSTSWELGWLMHFGKGWQQRMVLTQTSKEMVQSGKKLGGCVCGNKSSSVWLWRLVWLMALFGWLSGRMFPSHYPCCMESKHRRDRKVGRGIFCKVKTISQMWFKPLLTRYSEKSPITTSSLQPW